MKNKSTPSRRSRAEILAAIAKIPAAVQGKICSMTKTLADGSTATYYNLQQWRDGKNHTTHIPTERLAEFRKALEGGESLRSLEAELSDIDAESILSSASSLKKKSRKSRSGARQASAS